jgi:hypothetical protein
MRLGEAVRQRGVERLAAISGAAALFNPSVAVAWHSIVWCDATASRLVQNVDRRSDAPESPDSG